MVAPRAVLWGGYQSAWTANAIKANAVLSEGLEHIALLVGAQGVVLCRGVRES